MRPSRLPGLALALAGLTLIWFVAPSTGCGSGDTADSGAGEVVADAQPDLPPDTGAPDKGNVPDTAGKGLGQNCTSIPTSPKGDCGDGSVCLPISATENICFQDCTEPPYTCPKGQDCLEGSGQKLACFILADKGKPCGLKARTVCDLNNVPGLVCQGGTCQLPPTDGWGEGKVCAYSHKSLRGDCRKDLICLQISTKGNGVARCFIPCDAKAPCAAGMVCATGPMKEKVCYLISKKGEPCGTTVGRMCDPKAAETLVCRSGVCELETVYNGLGEKCAGKIGDPRGTCKAGLLCLDAGGRQGYCYKDCDADGKCPSGEICVIGPEPSVGKKVCLVPRTKGQDCDMTQRKICQPGQTPFLGCVGGKCIEVPVGGACQDAKVCGPLECKKFDQGDANGFCLMKCDKATPCPTGMGGCTGLPDQSSFCVPPGTMATDAVCEMLPDRSGQKLNTSKLCKPGLMCMRAQSQKTPQGVCMNVVGSCGPGACPAGYLCLAAGQINVCALDCSKSAGVCKTGTNCTTVGSSKICLAP